MSNTELYLLSAHDLAAKLAAKEVTSEELVRVFADRIEHLDKDIHAFLFVDVDGALQTAKQVDADRAAGKKLHPFAGVPIAIKDNMVQRGKPTTCASKILEGWLPPYDATIVLKLQEAGLPIFGQNQHGRIRHGIVYRALGFRADPQPVGFGADPGRIRRWFGRGGGSFHGAVGAGV